MLTLTINTDGAAFTIQSADADNGTPNPGPEVARLLRQVARDIEAHGITGGTLVDDNGNACGAWSLDEPAPAATCERCGDTFDPDQAGTSDDPALCADCTSHNADRVTL